MNLKLLKGFSVKKNINNLKVLLANEATKILHGEAASKNSEQTARDTFQKGGLGSDLPEINIKLGELKKGVNILDFIANNKILSSKSEVRRVIANKGLKINDVVIRNDKKILNEKDLRKIY